MDKKFPNGYYISKASHLYVVYTLPIFMTLVFPFFEWVIVFF
jgi:hypothetical protein